MTKHQNFKVVRDGDEIIVCDSSVSAMSFVMVPRDYGFMFENTLNGVNAAGARAIELARKSRAGETIALRMMETPDRFEEIADTRYGVAW